MKSKSIEAKVAALERRILASAPENKFNDLDVSYTNVPPATGISYNLAAIAAGTSVNTRIGLGVTVTHIEMHFAINYTTSLLAATNESPAYRVYIVQDKQQIADLGGITISDFVDNPALPITQLRNNATLQRFTVLYDSKPQIVFTGVPGTGVPNDAMVSSFKTQLHVSKRVRIPVHYNGTAGTDIQRNGIWMLVVTNMSGAAGVSVFDYIATSRVTFQDS